MSHIPTPPASRFANALPWFRWLRWVLAAASAVTMSLGMIPGAVGCSADAGAGPLTESSFLDSYASAVCERVAPCCGGGVYDGAHCLGYAVGEIQSVRDGLEKRGEPWQFNLPYAERCLAALQALPNDCSGVPHADACELVYTGTVAVGGACSYPLDCAANTEPLDGARNSCTHLTAGGVNIVTCLRESVRAVGETCGQIEGSSIAVCAADGYCRAGTCLARSDAGGTCPCLDGARCDHATDTCVALSRAGEPCDEHWDCEFLGCREDDLCMSLTEVVAPWCHATLGM